MVISCLNCNGAGCDFCGQRGHHTLNKSRRHCAAKPETDTVNNTDTALIEWAEKQTWSNFATDVARKGRTYGLSERQRAALESMKAKVESSKPATSSAAPKGVEGYAGAVAMLGHIDASGNKWPKVFLSLKSDVDDEDEDRRLKLYRYQTGMNMGSAGIKLDETWLGNIDRTSGIWSPTPKAGKLDRETKAKVWNVLKMLRDDPATLFARNGKLLGTCACCGRALSNDESVRIGIGPECRGKLGGVV